MTLRWHGFQESVAKGAATDPTHFDLRLMGSSQRGDAAAEDFEMQRLDHTSEELDRPVFESG
jgi:hypothetical protein